MPNPYKTGTAVSPRTGEKSARQDRLQPQKKTDRLLYHAVIVLRSGFEEREKEIKGLNLNGRIGLKEDGKIRVGPIVVACALLGKDRIQYRQELFLCHRKKVEVIAAFDLGYLAIRAAQRQAEQRRKQIFFHSISFLCPGSIENASLRVSGYEISIPCRQPDFRPFLSWDRCASVEIS